LNDFTTAALNKLITTSTTVFWFRRDLRLEDNTGLYHALRENSNVLPVFVFDTTILNRLEDKADRRVEFIHHSLNILKQQLEELGSSLAVVHTDPIEFYGLITPKAVYANHDYEPYARQRDEKIGKILASKGAHFSTFKDQVIFEKNEIVKDNGSPYTIFTPYSRKWKSSLTTVHLKACPALKYTHNLKKLHPLGFPSLKEIGFVPTGTSFPKRSIKISVISDYHHQRDFPSIKGTSRLSVHLRFGTVSIRKLAALAVKTNETWLNELIWREFYQMILWHFPHVETKAFKPAFDRIVWRNNEEEFRSWCEGQTGYPIIDAGMRALNATGFMHNRVRMIVASFLTKHLLIDWRWGEAYFAEKLLDYDLAANNGGWQWAAGSGCDAVPYFRIFNPELQTQKFDPHRDYIHAWIPEIGTNQYPQPIVQHTMARQRALKTYKAALGK
jgi:deoxyribodipyrimidine photo-lyase